MAVCESGTGGLQGERKAQNIDASRVRVWLSLVWKKEIGRGERKCCSLNWKSESGQSWCDDSGNGFWSPSAHLFLTSAWVLCLSSHLAVGCSLEVLRLSFLSQSLWPSSKVLSTTDQASLLTWTLFQMLTPCRPPSLTPKLRRWGPMSVVIEGPILKGPQASAFYQIPEESYSSHGSTAG